MARKPLNASIERIETTDLTELYVTPTEAVSTASLVLTNLTINIISVAIYINNGNSDFLLVKEKIAGGVGKDWIVKELPTQKLNAGFSVKVQAEASDAFNAFLSVSEISER